MSHASLIISFELSFEELIEFNEDSPDFLASELVAPGYTTLHLMPPKVSALKEFLSWPQEDLDPYYFQMTQQRATPAIRHLRKNDFEGAAAVEEILPGEMGVFECSSFVELQRAAAHFFSKPLNSIITVLLIVNNVPRHSPSESILDEAEKLFQRQRALNLTPSIDGCQAVDWHRFAVSCSWGAGGEFRPDARRGGLFGILKEWQRSAGGWIQLRHLKAELSNVIGVTGKYGD